jgi:hypothetical protein
MPRYDEPEVNVVVTFALIDQLAGRTPKRRNVGACSDVSGWKRVRHSPFPMTATHSVSL